MAIYRVVVSRVEYQCAEVKVETADEKEVEQLALEEASDFEVVHAEESAIEIVRLPDEETP